MPVPALQILYRRYQETFFGWSQLERTEAKYYKLYSCASPTGTFLLLRSNIENFIDKTYKNKVCAIVKDSQVPIPENSKYYFKLTYVNISDVESDITLSQVVTVYPPTVSNHFEGEQREANSHIFGWSEDNQRWEKQVVSLNGELLVDTKIATKQDDTKQYILVDDNRRVIASIDPSNITRFNEYQEELSVSPDIEVDIFTYISIPVFYLEKIVCTGTSDCRFELKINGSTIQVLMNSWCNRNVCFDFSNKSFYCISNSVVTITAYHKETDNQDFLQVFLVSLSKL